MGDSDRGVGGVDALAARPARAERVDPEVLLLDLHVDFLSLGQHRDGCRGGMDSSARFRDWHALYPVDAALVFETAVDVPSFDQRNGAAVARVQDLEFPALSLCVARVHPEQIRGEQ